MPNWYIFFSFLAVIICSASFYFQTVEGFFWAVISGFVLQFLIFLNELYLIYTGKGFLGRFIILFGIIFWFYLGALELALDSVPFSKIKSSYFAFSESIPAQVVALSILAVSLFSFFLILGWRITSKNKRLIYFLGNRFDAFNSFQLDFISLILVLVAWFVFYYGYEGNLTLATQDLLLMRSSEERIGPQKEVGLLSHLSLLGIFGSAFALIRLALNTPGHKIIRFISIFLMLPLLFFGAGSRFNLGFLLLPAFIILVAPVKTPSDLNYRKKFAFIFSIALIGLVLLQGAIRTYGFKHAIKESVDFKTGIVGYDHFEALMVSVDIVERENRFFYEPILPFFLTHFIPKSIWPEKPYSNTWEYYNQLYTSGSAYNVTPSVIGQYYLNWGFLGVIYIGFFFGSFTRLCDYWISTLNFELQMLSVTVVGLLLAFLFLSYRFFYPLYFAYPLFGFLVYWFLTTRSVKANRGAS